MSKEKREKSSTTISLFNSVNLKKKEKKKNIIMNETLRLDQIKKKNSNIMKDKACNGTHHHQRTTGFSYQESNDSNTQVWSVSK